MIIHEINILKWVNNSVIMLIQFLIMFNNLLHVFIQQSLLSDYTSSFLT